MNLIWSFLLICLLGINTAFAQNIGFKEVKINVDSTRPLTVAIWYPTDQAGPVSAIGENAAFYGVQAIHNATIDIQSAPVVLLSHGYRGNWLNLSWLAATLAHKGYVVAAPNHPGTTSRNHPPELAAKWWLRVKDISRVLDYLVTDKQWQSGINRDDISSIGHSLGGWTVMQLAGAVFDRPTFNRQCVILPNPRVCGLASELGLKTALNNEPVAGVLYDSRIKRVVSLDLGLARSFSPASLKAIHIPVLILAAGIDIGDLPQAKESGYLAEFLPLFQRRYKVYEQAAHFSFMQLCKLGAEALLDKDEPGDGIICHDGSISREALHQQMLQDILQFLH